MATEIVRLRPYGAALKDEWTHFPAGGEASARTNKNKTSVETPGTTEGVETATSGKSVSVKAGVGGAAYKLPEGAKVLKAILWVYARAGTAEEDVTVIGRVGPKAEPNATLKLNATAFGWHSAETPKSVLEEITPKSLEEASLAATSNKTTGTADKLVEWHIELEVETTGGKTTFEAAVAMRAGARPTVAAAKVATALVGVLSGAQLSAAAKMVATGSLGVRAGPQVSVAAVKVARESVAGSAGARVSVSAAKVATGAVVARAGALQAVSGARAAQVALVIRTGAAGAVAARAVFVSAPVLRAGATGATTARVSFAGVVRFAAGARVVVTVPLPPERLVPEFGRVITGQAAGSTVGQAEALRSSPVSGTAAGAKVGQAGAAGARTGRATAVRTGEASPTTEREGP